MTNAYENNKYSCTICKKDKGRDYSKRKLAIHTSDHLLHCWVCGYRSKNLLHLLKCFYPHMCEEYIVSFLNTENLSENELKIKEKVVLPQGFKLLVEMDPHDEVRIGAVNYLKARGVGSLSDLWRWKFGISKAATKHSGRIIVPSYNASGYLNFFTGRSFIPSETKRYENADVSRDEIVFNEINIDWSKELTIVEGVFDLFKCNENATPILGSELTADFKLFEKLVIHKTPVLLAMDNDKIGIYKSMKIAAKLNEYGIDVRLLNHSDDYEDVGSMTKNEFMRIREDAILYSKEYLLRKKIQDIL